MDPICRRLLAALVAIGATFAYAQLVIPASGVVAGSTELTVETVATAP